MVFSLAATAFAEGEGEGSAETNPPAATGSITINGAHEDNIYEIYLMLDLESYNPKSGAYSYKVNSNWSGFFATEDALKYVKIDTDGYVTWIAAEDDDTKAAFAKLALAYAKDENHKINPVKSSKNPGDFVITTNQETGVTSGVFSGLELGYYLVDSTMGALCGLTTTNPDASINAKNGIPTVDKQVLEDSTSQWGASNTADIGQTVEYRVTINVHAGAENYVLHDVMEDGLTFKSVTKIEHVIPGKETHVVDSNKYTVNTGNAVISDGCDFEVQFTKEFCDDLETNDKIVVTYEAMLNRNAVIAGDGNVNRAWLSFGDRDKNHTSNEDSVTTYTYGIDIIKTDSQNTLLDGAEFKIYDAETGGNEIAVVILKATQANNEKEALKDSQGNYLTFDHDKDESTPEVKVSAIESYRRARTDETGVEIVVQNGRIRIVGFDNGTYYLEETDAPDGYNKLSGRQKFIISDGNLDAIFNNNIYSTGSGVHVVNKTGSMLPETGAEGTLMFITFGTLVVLGTGVLLVTKKRMSMIED